MTLSRRTVLALLIAIAVVAGAVALSINPSDAVPLAGLRKGG
jgi:hypothetical protein